MFRDFTASDKTVFMEMCRQFYASDAVLHKVPEEYFQITFNEIIRNSPYARGLIIEHNEIVAGYCLLSFTYSNEVAGLVVMIEEAYICPDFQGHGLGSELLAYIESEYEGKAKRFRLEVTDTNLGAIKLYEKFGYQQFDYVQMVKEIK